MFSIVIKSSIPFFNRELSFKTEHAMQAYVETWLLPDDEVYYFIDDDEYTPSWAR